tara:strand:+ start:16333 stop:17322 length:990 start_codon:yes stop_codon:yes gene_type:complete
MAGVLDPKSRIIDAFVTKNGRSQLAEGKMRIEFASFTDRHTFYEKDSVSGSSDASGRLFLESTSLPFDQVTFESDDTGRLIEFTGGDISVVDGRLYQPITGTQSGRVSLLHHSSSQFYSNSGYPVFASLCDNLLTASFDNFRNLSILGDKDYSSRAAKTFRLSNDSAAFSLTTMSPFDINLDITKIDLSTIEPLFLDKRLAHLDNFKFLPPVLPNTNESSEGDALGSYTDLNQEEILTFDDLASEIEGKPSQEVIFEETSQFNNIVCQIFEVIPPSPGSPDSEFKKLDVIDFGDFNDDGTNRHVFFIGKIFIDELGLPTFINLFTLVFE